MATRDTYYPGGFIAAAAQGNRSSRADSVAVTFTTWDVNGVQTLQRALTGAEVAAFAAEAALNTQATNQSAILTKAQTALTTNATFLAIANPTAAQVAAQAKALTRETNGLIRLLLNALTDVSDT